MKATYFLPAIFTLAALANNASAESTTKSSTYGPATSTTTTTTAGKSATSTTTVTVPVSPTVGVGGFTSKTVSGGYSSSDGEIHKSNNPGSKESSGAGVAVTKSF